MSIILIRSLILYVVVIGCVRLMGKRQLGEMQPSELVITILISNIATLPLENTAIPLLVGILPIFALVCFEVLTSWLTLKSMRLRRMVSGSPKIIIRNGEIVQETMRVLRMTVDDLLTALRSQQVFSPEEVQFAIVETTGVISVYPKADYRTVTQKDVSMNQPSADPPVVVISDGQVIQDALRGIEKDRQWLEQALQAKDMLPSETFLAMADREGLCVAVKKKGKGVGSSK